jgi:hypothetical protein
MEPWLEPELEQKLEALSCCLVPRAPLAERQSHTFVCSSHSCRSLTQPSRSVSLPIVLSKVERLQIPHFWVPSRRSFHVAARVLRRLLEIRSIKMKSRQNWQGEIESRQS